jgi:DNA-binding MarR family transcriptional regulator
MALYDVFSDLTRLETRLWDRVDASLRAEIEVPLGRFEAMLVMRRLGPCRVLDVADALAITVGGASKLIDRLSASGFCTRLPNPADQRSSLLVLAPAVLPLLERGQSVIEVTLHETLGAHLSADGIKVLRSQLHALLLANGGTDQPTGTVGTVSAPS